MGNAPVWYTTPVFKLTKTTGLALTANAVTVVDITTFTLAVATKITELAVNFSAGVTAYLTSGELRLYVKTSSAEAEVLLGTKGALLVGGSSIEPNVWNSIVDIDPILGAGPLVLPEGAVIRISAAITNVHVATTFTADTLMVGATL